MKKKAEKNRRFSFGKTGKLVFALLLCVCLLSAGCGAGAGKENQEKGSGTEADEQGAGGKDLSGLPHAVIEVRDYGTIKVALDAEAAPATVENFIKLAKEGFYDGLTFHRIIDGFMIQGGDPAGNGTGGSGETIVGEFASNGHENPISHVKGVISMARSSDPDSASSQFFITVADAAFLDGEYAAFGYVTEGMDAAERIAADAQPIDDNGTIPPANQPVISRITIEQ